MATYRQADPEVKEMVNLLTEKFYPEMKEHGLTFGVLFHCSEKGMEHNGYPAAATVKANPLKDRVDGKPDCTIVVCKQWWDRSSEKSRTAVLHHELHHCVLVRDEKGAVKCDDASRPCVQLRKHDFWSGGFYDIVERYGHAAPEAQLVNEQHRKFVQLKFPWD